MGEWEVMEGGGDERAREEGYGEILASDRMVGRGFKGWFRGVGGSH